MTAGYAATRLLAMLVSASGLAHQLRETPAVLIRDTTVIDGTGRPPMTHISVLLSKGRISRIGPAAAVEIPKHIQIIDGSGKYVIPGLWNMHVHLGSYEDGKPALAAYLREGVTGVRDCGSPLDDILRLRRDTEDGTILGPHMIVAGPIIQGPLPFRMPVFVSVRSTEEARAAVRMLKARGVDFVKVQDAIPHAIYVAVASEANLDHIPFAGHIPPTVLPEEASDLGQHSIEHFGGRFWGVLIGCSTREAELHSEEVQMYHDVLSALEQKQPPPVRNMRAAFTRTIVETYDSWKAAAIVSQFRQKKIWQCPTFVVLHTLWNDKDLHYTAEDLNWGARLLEKEAQHVPMMQAAGIGLLAGTDLPPDARNGTIHDELAALVQAGLTPMQAVQTATRNAARFLEKSDTLGTIEKGKTADLIILNANPLHDIRATSGIYKVIIRGRALPTADPSSNQ